VTTDRLDRRQNGARLTDRIEDLVGWLLMLLAVGLIAPAVLVGHVVHDYTAARERADASGRVAMHAGPLDTNESTASGLRMVLAQRASPGGHPTADHVEVTPGHATNEIVLVGVEGDAVTSPAGAGPAAVAGWLTGCAVVLAGWALLALAWIGVRAITARRNAATWAREWALVEPEWSGRRG